jgi:hypothetical protein
VYNEKDGDQGNFQRHFGDLNRLLASAIPVSLSQIGNLIRVQVTGLTGRY